MYNLKFRHNIINFVKKFLNELFFLHVFIFRIRLFFGEGSAKAVGTTLAQTMLAEASVFGGPFRRTERPKVSKLRKGPPNVALWGLTTNNTHFHKYSCWMRWSTPHLNSIRHKWEEAQIINHKKIFLVKKRIKNPKAKIVLLNWLQRCEMWCSPDKEWFRCRSRTLTVEHSSMSVYEMDKEGGFFGEETVWIIVLEELWLIVKSIKNHKSKIERM